MDPNDGLPSSICYKCLFKLDKFAKFRGQCIQSENRLKEITNRVNEMDHSNSSEMSNYNHTQQVKTKEDYVVEDSVVMVVDPSLDYDSSEESDNNEQLEQDMAERDNTPDGETSLQESFFKNVSMCQYCDKAFVSPELCTEHEQAYHDSNLPYNCIECSLVFAERSQFIQHTKQVHGNDKPYHCPECDKSFSRRSDLRKHSIVHTGIRPYQCHYCLKNFSRNTNLSKHLRIHAGQKPHVCPLCPRSFVARGDLQRHVLVHSGMKPYACRKCPLTFGRRDKLIKHEVRHGPMSPRGESENEVESHNMVVNVNPFSNLMTSPNHIGSAANADYELPRVPDHITGESSFHNEHSQKSPAKSSKTKQSPTKPKTVSNRNRPKNIKCHQCPKRFSSLDAYKTHVSIAHIGSRVFQCKICFKKFNRKRELDRHVPIHSGMKPFSCNQCDKTFTRRDKLVKHEQTHECLVANMPCIECGATFEKKPDLVAHIKSHFTDDFSEKSPENVPNKEFPLSDTFFDLET